ncbi:hypothetical protein FRC12_002331 [Ceratobasidium sp. 428]|nr:hypothetical protein FRC12_002331 [Ceratobasidium sp. 428]
MSQHNRENVQFLSVKIMSFVGKFVMDMLGVDNTTTPQELLLANYRNFEFLWVFLEHRNRISLVDGDKIRNYASTLFMITTNNQFYYAKTREAHLDYARMLAAAEIVSLIAHILLMVLDKGYEFQGVDVEWEQLLGSVIIVGDALDTSRAYAPELFYESRVDWTKFLDQLNLEVRLGARNAYGKAKFLREMVMNMTTWARNRGFLGDDNLPPQACGYPRCIQPRGHEKTLRVCLVCGKCKAVTYCSQSCQLG